MMFHILESVQMHHLASAACLMRQETLIRNGNYFTISKRDFLQLNDRTIVGTAVNVMTKKKIAVVLSDILEKLDIFRKADISICVLRQTRATLHCHFGSGLDGYGFEQLVIREKLCSFTPGIKATAAKSSAKLVSLCQTLMCFIVLLNPAQNSQVKA